MSTPYGWQIDPSTGDYVVLSGSPVEDTTILTSAYIRLKTRRTQWLYAPDTNYGSDFYKSHARILQTATLENYATKALNPLVTTNRAQSVSVATTAAQRGAIQLSAQIIDSSGQPQVLNFNPGVGV